MFVETLRGEQHRIVVSERFVEILTAIVEAEERRIDPNSFFEIRIVGERFGSESERLFVVVLFQPDICQMSVDIDQKTRIAMLFERWNRRMCDPFGRGVVFVL